MAKIACLVAARPNFVKVAPLVAALESATPHDAVIIHSGQHYDPELDELITRDLGMPPPEHHLGVGSGTHAYQTGETMIRLESLFADNHFDALVVAGDVNATLAGALVAAKVQMPLIHLEAGIRSFDRSMPEEVNRIVTDALSDLCLAPSRDALFNLEHEGIVAPRAVFVGNCMIDSLDAHIDQARSRGIAAGLGFDTRAFAVLTLHRPANVDQGETLARILDTLEQVAERLPILFPAHPRTTAQITAAGIEIPPGIAVLPPLGYIDFLSLVADSRMVITDSGGIQEETTVLGIPCITLRENTERPVTVTEGTNQIVGREPDSILRAIDNVLATEMPSGTRPEGWDGNAAKRAASSIDEYVSR